MMRGWQQVYSCVAYLDLGTVMSFVFLLRSMDRSRTHSSRRTASASITICECRHPRLSWTSDSDIRSFTMQRHLPLRQHENARPSGRIPPSPSPNRPQLFAPNGYLRFGAFAGRALPPGDVGDGRVDATIREPDTLISRLRQFRTFQTIRTKTRWVF